MLLFLPPSLYLHQTCPLTFLQSNTRVHPPLSAPCKLNFFLLWTKNPLNNMMEIWHLRGVYWIQMFSLQTQLTLFMEERNLHFFFFSPSLCQFNTTFWPPSSEPQAPTYLLSVGNKIFTRRERCERIITELITNCSECAVFLLNSVNETL